MNYKYCFLLSVFLFLLQGCDPGYDKDRYVLSLDACYLYPEYTAFTVGSGYSEFEFWLDSYQTDWYFDDIMPWISLSPTSGSNSSSINLTVQENVSTDQRIGVFGLKTAKVADYVTEMYVVQDGAALVASLEQSSITFTGSSGTKSIKVSSNCKWTISNSLNWLTVSSDDQYSCVNIQVSENTTNSSRSGYISIICGNNVLASLYIIQEAAGISASASALEFDNTAGEYSLQITSDVSWTASSSQTWIQITPCTGDAGVAYMKVTVSPNSSVSSRTGYVYLCIGDSKRYQISVDQKGLYLKFSGSSFSASAGVDTKTIHIVSNTSWTIDSYPDWVSVSPLSGSGECDITVTTKNNPNVSKRKGTISATVPGISLSTSIGIVQAGKIFNLGTSSVSCSDKAQSIVINVTSDGEWTSSSDQSWISVSPPSASGNADVTITVTENTSDDARTGKVTLDIGNMSYVINVVQKGKFFKVNTGQSHLGSKGGYVSIDIATTDHWTVSVEDALSWVSFSQSSGDGDASILATIGDNPSVNGRKAMIVFNDTYHSGIKITLHQDPRYLRVSRQNVLFFASGGESEDITVETDGTYSFSQTGEWFSVNQKENNAFSVNATENTSNFIREGSVTISLTDLKEGTYKLTLPVVQTGVGGNFLIDGFTSDTKWDVLSVDGTSITVTGYTTNTNLDNTTVPSLSVDITGYRPDSSLDSDTGSGGIVDNGGYPADDNLDNPNRNGGDIDKGDFPDDSDWK